jgi:predicted SnoaL-like aldol condensation-catalyzing enzyme
MKNILLFVFTVLFLSGCMKQNPQLIKETDANKKVVLSFYNTAFNQKDPVKAVDAYKGTAEARSIKGDTLLKGRTEIANSISNFLNTFTDIKFKSEWAFAEGDMVIVRWIINCTPKENYSAYPAGHPLEIRGAAFFKLIDRKIFNSFTYWNIK